MRNIIFSITFLSYLWYKYHKLIIYFKPIVSVVKQNKVADGITKPLTYSYNCVKMQTLLYTKMSLGIHPNYLPKINLNLEACVSIATSPPL